MKRGIEFCVMDNGLPVNSICMVDRLRELIKEKGGNCLNDMRDNYQIRSVLWLLNQQFFGQMATIRMDKEWEECYKGLEVLSKQEEEAEFVKSTDGL